MINKEKINSLLDEIQYEIDKIDIRDEILSVLYKNRLERAREDLITIWFYSEALEKRYGMKRT